MRFSQYRKKKLETIGMGNKYIETEHLSEQQFKSQLNIVRNLVKVGDSVPRSLRNRCVLFSYAFPYFSYKKLNQIILNFRCNVKY